MMMMMMMSATLMPMRKASRFSPGTSALRDAEAFLPDERAGERLDRARELDEQAVARGLGRLCR